MENNENTYHGIPGTRFIWHGEWSDPEVEYQGKLYNGNSLEDTLWSIYRTECEADGKGPSEEEYDNLPTDWFTDNFLDIIMEDMNESKNAKKSVIKLNEEQLRKVVAKSVKRVLKEVYMDNGDDLMGMYDGEEGPTNEPDSDIYSPNDELTKNELILVPMACLISCYRDYCSGLGYDEKNLRFHEKELLNNMN